MFEQFISNLETFILGKPCYFKGNNSQMEEATVTRVDLNISKHHVNIVIHVKHKPGTRLYPETFYLGTFKSSGNTQYYPAFFSKIDYNKYYTQEDK